MTEVLLARYAECTFWMARYVERAENLARILDVNETFSRDARGNQNWLSIVQLHDDEEPFFKSHETATADAVLHFYVQDAGNPSSIVSAIKSARDNARTLRPLISTEMWAQLNKFQNRLGALEEIELSPGRLTGLFSEIKEACQTHTGITEGTFHRDQAWYFYQLGRYIERADQITRLLDMKYHLLLPHAADDIGSPVDVSQWNALLRSAAGYHAYRRQHPRGITPERVAGFLLLNRQFPRSAYFCVRQVEMLLTEMKAQFSLRGGDDAAEELDRLRAVLGTLGISEIVNQGLHEFLDLLQRQFIAVTRECSVAFFGHRHQPLTMPMPLNTQSQSQLVTAGRQ